VTFPKPPLSLCLHDPFSGSRHQVLLLLHGILPAGGHIPARFAHVVVVLHAERIKSSVKVRQLPGRGVAADVGRLAGTGELEIRAGPVEGAVRRRLPAEGREERLGLRAPLDLLRRAGKELVDPRGGSVERARTLGEAGGLVVEADGARIERGQRPRLRGVEVRVGRGLALPGRAAEAGTGGVDEVVGERDAAAGDPEARGRPLRRRAGSPPRPSLSTPRARSQSPRSGRRPSARRGEWLRARSSGGRGRRRGLGRQKPTRPKPAGRGPVG